MGCLEVFFSTEEGEDLVLHLRLGFGVDSDSDSDSDCGEVWSSSGLARVSVDSGA